MKTLKHIAPTMNCLLHHIKFLSLYLILLLFTLNTFATDRNFLCWGHNNEPLNKDTPIVVDMSAGISGLSTEVDFTSIQRTWKVI